MEKVARDMLSQEFDLFIKENEIALPTDKLASFFIEKGIKMILDSNSKEIAVSKIRSATESGYSWGMEQNTGKLDKKKRKADSEEKEIVIHE